MKELQLLNGNISGNISLLQDEQHATFDMMDPYNLKGKIFETLNPKQITDKFFGLRKSSEQVKRPQTSNDHRFVKKRGASVELPYTELKSNRLSVGTRPSSQQSTAQILEKPHNFENKSEVQGMKDNLVRAEMDFKTIQ